MTEDLFRLIGAALLGVFCVLLLRRGNPEMAFAVGTAAALWILAQTADRLFSMRDEASFLIPESALGKEVASVLAKIALTSVVSRLGAEAARDAGQNALAYAVELLGTFFAMLLAVPVLKNVFRAVEACFS